LDALLNVLQEGLIDLGAVLLVLLLTLFGHDVLHEKLNLRGSLLEELE
jgi:hypothetical protein